MDRLGEIAKHLDAADDLAGAIAERGDGDLDWNPGTGAMQGKDQQGLSAGLAHDDAPVKRAMFLAAQAMAILVHMHQDVVVAGATDHLDAVQPVIRWAAWFQNTIRRSRSVM